MDNINEVIRREAYLIWEKDKCKPDWLCWKEAEEKLKDKEVMQHLSIKILENTWGVTDQ